MSTKNILMSATAWQQLSIAEPGQAVFTTPGDYTWTCPPGVTTVSALAIGSGAPSNGVSLGGGGGGLAYRNNISVTPGTQYAIKVGTYTSGDNASITEVFNASVLGATGGYAGNSSVLPGYGGSQYGGTGTVGYSGGRGLGSSSTAANADGGGGGGAAGYAGNGGNGNQYGGNGSSIAGGGGGGGGSSGSGTGGSGGGVGIYGQGASGTGGSGIPIGTAGNGTAGSNGSGLNYGAGGGGKTTGVFGSGAVRLIWGANQTYPNPAPIISYESYQDSGTSLTTYTFNNVNIGGPGLIVVGIQSESGSSNTSVSSITIGGIAGTLVQNSDSGYVYAGIASAVIASGTTANISITFANAQSRCAIAVWRLASYVNSTALQSGTVAIASNSTGNSVTLSSLPVNSAVIAVYTLGSQTIRSTWTNIDEKYDRDIAASNTGATGGHRIVTAAGNFIVSTSHTTSAQITALAAAAWR